MSGSAPWRHPLTPPGRTVITVSFNSEEVVRNQNKDMSMLEEVDMKDKLDMEDDKGEDGATLYEDCQSDQLTTDIVENNSGKDEERASLSSPPTTW